MGLLELLLSTVVCVSREKGGSWRGTLPAGGGGGIAGSTVGGVIGVWLKGDRGQLKSFTHEPSCVTY